MTVTDNIYSNGEMSDEAYMALAIEEADCAASLGEVPVGCVIVWDTGHGTERIVARTHNTRETEKNALGHAECTAIREACEVLGGWRLHRATLYVTVEPCPMCAGAIINARVRRVVYGCGDARAGALGGLFDIREKGLNHTPWVTSGVMESACTARMEEFFSSLREKRQKKHRDAFSADPKLD